MPMPQWHMVARHEAPVGALKAEVVGGIWLRRPLGDGDGEAERLDPVLESLRLHSGIVTALEVVGTGGLTAVFVEGTAREQVPGRLQDGVSDRNRLWVPKTRLGC